MKINTGLHIKIPDPCSQNWDAMPAESGGRHCMQCNNVVHDFSQMSDTELLRFFEQRPSLHCGRFHRSQLDRDIKPIIIKRQMLLHRFNKLAATFFTILSFKGLTSNATVKNSGPDFTFDHNFKKIIKGGPGKIVITGTVKDKDGKPLEKATIQFDAVQVAITDNEGRFSFELDSVSANSHNLYFAWGDLITVVRNYHPAMASAEYDVVLKKRAEEFHVMGIMPPPLILDLPSLKFKKNVYKLSADNKAMLAAIAAKMRENPFANILIAGYAPVCGRQYMYGYRVENIKKYLVEKQGISADRIAVNIEVDGGDINIVDIKSGNQ